MKNGSRIPLHPNRKYIPDPINKILSGQIDRLQALTQREPLISAIDAYRAFDERQAGWIKVELRPRRAAVGTA